MIHVNQYIKSEIRKLPETDQKMKIPDLLFALLMKKLNIKISGYPKGNYQCMTNIRQIQKAMAAKLMQLKKGKHKIWSEVGNQIIFSITLLYNIHQYIIQCPEYIYITPKYNVS
ncbi:Hypothetical_protein [Hexamita inflata]|uniref:Hypothetical_protein n=1 Tax=Hexamita inflata TaxID=28002 RepID=A0AA86QJK5_9EUKA|nr:Hypothetical protein HINF_LOCUS43313 [Hexamita inflata]